jgi:hypothetical protein
MRVEFTLGKKPKKYFWLSIFLQRRGGWADGESGGLEQAHTSSNGHSGGLVASWFTYSLVLPAKLLIVVK